MEKESIRRKKVKLYTSGWYILDIKKKYHLDYYTIKNVLLKNNILFRKRELTGRSNPFFGKKHTKKTLKIISETHKGKILTVIHRNIISKFMKDNKHAKKLI